LTRKMELEVRQAWNNVSEAYNQTELMKATVHDAEVNLETSATNYRAGLIPISELLEAQTIHRQAFDQLIDAKISYQNALTHYRILVEN